MSMDPIDPIYLQRIFEQDIHGPDRVQRALRSRDDDSPDEDSRHGHGARNGDEDDAREAGEEPYELDLSDSATPADTVVHGEVLDAEPGEIEAASDESAASPEGLDSAPKEIEAGPSVEDDGLDADAVVVELNEDLEPRLHERRRQGDDDSHIDFEV